MLAIASMAWRRRDEGAVPEKRTRDKNADNAGNGNQQRKPSTSRPSSPPTAARRASRSPWTSGATTSTRTRSASSASACARTSGSGSRTRALHRARVNGVRARVIDARVIDARFGDRVLRERSWREGDWTAVAGAGAPPCVDLGGLLRRPPMRLRTHDLPRAATRRDVDVVCAERGSARRRAAAGPGAAG